MRLSNALVLALSGSTLHVDCFQTSPRIALRNPPQASASSVKTATLAEETELVTLNGDATYEDINALAFRALQKQCKALGLSAKGTTAALRGRLLEHFGLMRDATKVVVPTATAAEIEVGGCCSSKISP